MAGKYTPKTDSEKLSYLMATDERKEDHIKQLQISNVDLTEAFKELTIAIIGSKYNKKVGFLEVHNELNEGFQEMKKQIVSLKDFQSNIQPQFNIGKWVFLIFVIAWIGAIVADIREGKTIKNKIEINH